MEIITPELVDKYGFIFILAILFLPIVIFIKKAFQFRGLKWQAYVPALLGFIPIVNIFMLVIARQMVGYKNSIFTFIFCFLCPPMALIYAFTSLFFEFPLLEKIKSKNKPIETKPIIFSNNR
jgi:hypothetical protein